MKPPHIKAHRRIWMALAVVLPLGFIAAIMGKLNAPVDAPAVQLEPPAKNTN